MICRSMAPRTAGELICRNVDPLTCRKARVLERAQAGDMTDVRFRDRSDAGRRLGEALALRRLEDVAVYALPRGGAPVAWEVARRLHAPLDLVLVRKLGAPGSPELALGALAEGDPPVLVVNDDVRRLTAADEAYLQGAREDALKEIARRREVYLAGRVRLDPRGRTAIVVDDGLATGATARAAVRALRARGAARVIVAVPVGPPETVADLAREADEVIALEQPQPFYGVGAFYDDFHQLDDAEVTGLLARAPPPSATSTSD